MPELQANVENDEQKEALTLVKEARERHHVSRQQQGEHVFKCFAVPKLTIYTVPALIRWLMGPCAFFQTSCHTDNHSPLITIAGGGLCKSYEPWPTPPVMVTLMALTFMFRSGIYHSFLVMDMLNPHLPNHWWNSQVFLTIAPEHCTRLSGSKWHPPSTIPKGIPRIMHIIVQFPRLSNTKIGNIDLSANI